MSEFGDWRDRRYRDVPGFHGSWLQMFVVWKLGIGTRKGEW
jgi:hypothetical protein